MPKAGKSIVKNGLFGLSTWVLPLLLSFVATPIIVHSLGNEDYGVYALVLGFIGYSFTFGIGRAITKYLAEYRSKGESETARKLVSATLTLNLFVGIAGALIVFGLTNFFVEEVFQIPAENAVSAKHAFWVAALIIFMTMMNQVGSSILQGAQRFDIYSKLFNLNSFGILIGNMALALSGFGLVSLLIWNLAVLSVSTVLGLFFAKKHVPEFALEFNFQKVWLQRVLGFSAWIIGYQILGNVLLLFERGWIIRKLGAEALTYYVVPMTIGIYIHSSVASLMLVLFPLTSENENNPERLAMLYRKATKITCIFVFFVTSSLLALSNEFLTLWMGAEFAVETSTLLIFHTITFSLAAILVIAWQMADGLGYPAYNFAVFAVCLIISLGGMILLIEDYQNTGMAISRLLGFGTIFLSIFISEKWFFGEFQIAFWLKLLLILIPTGVITGFVEWAVLSQFDLNWLTMILAGGIGGCVYVGLILVSGLVTQEERTLVRGVFSS